MRTSNLFIGFCLSLMLLATCGGCVGALQRMNRGREPESQRTGAVQIMATCPGGPKNAAGASLQNWGSGVAIGPWTVITAAHVTPCSDGEVFASQGDGVVLHLRVEVVDHRHDLARLQVIGGGSFKVTGIIRTGPTLEGQRICTATGMPSRDRRCGQVDGIRKQLKGDLSSDMVVEPGNSGSGVYDHRGRLVGIVTHQRKTVEGTVFGSLCTSLYGKEWLLQ